MNTMAILNSLLSATVTSGTILLFAGLGGLIGENSGMGNLGTEGIMLVGAISGYIVAQATGSLVLAVLAAMLVGALLAGLHAYLTVSLRASQVVSGLAMTIFGTGFSAFLGSEYVGSVARVSFHAVPIPGLFQIPLVGQMLFNQNVLVYMGYLLVPLLWFFLYRTRWGMQLRAVGENPAAADAAGLNVFRIRYASLMAGGALMGLSGVYLTLGYNSTWMEGIAGGRGWIAVALVIFSTWNPLRVVGGALLFGAISVLGLRLQAFGIRINTEFFDMLPYIATIVVLILVTGNHRKKRAAAPAALGLPYDREAR